MCKKAEAARLEALAMDKELQISQLLGKLDLDPSGGPDLPQLVETSQGRPNQPNHHHHHPSSSNNSPRHSQPLRWRPQWAHQVANPQQHRRGNQQDHWVASRPQVANHCQGHPLDRKEAHLRQQCHNSWHRRPMVVMGL